MPEENKTEKVITKQNRFPLWMIITAVVIVAIISGSVAVARSSSVKRHVAQQLELARKYISELNYEQAIIAYTAAIEIDPKNVDAYVELADLYVEMGDFEKAQEILIIGLEKVKVADKEQIEIKKSEIDQKKRAASNSDDYQDLSKAESDNTIDKVQSISATENGDDFSNKSTDISTTELTDETQLDIAAFALVQGDVVMFGSYEQDNIESNGKEPIEWIVLDASDDYVFLLSKKALDAVLYNEDPLNMEVTWETCTIRKWLNEKFYDTAFDENEKKAIKTVTLNNPDNSEHDSIGGNDTEDKIFLLSIDDVKNSAYGFSDQEYDEKRRCIATAYAKEQSATMNKPILYTDMGSLIDGKPACTWWLRSPGWTNAYAANVGGDRLFTGGNSAYQPSLSMIAVRPALYVNLKNAGDKIRISSDVIVESASYVEIPKAVIGDTIIFGSYEQDGMEENGKEPIEWIVIDKSEESVFVLSKYALDCKPYNTSNNNPTWENSTLRSWLNNEFFLDAFNKTEKESIEETLLKNSAIPDYNESYAGNDTIDKVFLLSYEEYENVLNSENIFGEQATNNLKRYCRGTAVAYSRGVQGVNFMNRMVCEWWLRNPSFCVNHAYDMNGNSVVLLYEATWDNIAVRPAIHIKLKP